MGLSKKHFKILAYDLARSTPENTETCCYQTWKNQRDNIVSFCYSQNSRFDKDLFLSACSLDYWKNKKRPY